MCFFALFLYLFPQFLWVAIHLAPTPTERCARACPTATGFLVCVLVCTNENRLFTETRLRQEITKSVDLQLLSYCKTCVLHVAGRQLDLEDSVIIFQQ